MEQYIKKSDIVAEIEKRINEIDEFGTYLSPKGTLTNLLCHLDTLEVKDVDLEKEIKSFTMSKELYEADSAIKAVAEHFFELGLNTKMNNIF